MPRPSTGGTPGALQLGSELTNALKYSGIGVREIARRLGTSHGRVGFWLRGERVPSEADLAGLLGAIGVTGNRKDALLQLRTEALDLTRTTPGVDRQLAILIDLESKPRTTMFEVCGDLVGGLLQTGDYSRRIMMEAGNSTAEAREQSAIRLGRAEALMRQRDPIQYTVVMGEKPLRYGVGGPDIMVPQLKHLLSIGKLDNVTIQMMPFDSGFTPMNEGNFVLLESPDLRGPVVQYQNYAMTTTSTDTRTVSRVKAATDTVRRAALSPADTAEVIAEIIEGMERAR